MYYLELKHERFNDVNIFGTLSRENELVQCTLAENRRICVLMKRQRSLEEKNERNLFVKRMFLSNEQTKRGIG